MGDDVQVLDVRDLLRQRSELVEVRGEEDRSASLSGEVSVDERASAIPNRDLTSVKRTLR